MSGAVVMVAAVNRHAMPDRHRLFGVREARLAAFDVLPRSLWLSGTINSQGELEPRLRALAGLRATLAAGEPPDAGNPDWPDPALAAGVSTTLARLELPTLCHRYGGLVDEVVGSLLWHLDLIIDYVDRGDSPAGARRRALAAFADDWQQRRRIVEELVDALGDVGDLLASASWNQLRGLLESAEWQAIVQAGRALAALPELGALLQRLGRAAPSPSTTRPHALTDAAAEQASEPCLRLRAARIPEMPGETRGVYRSGRIARMLPCETMLLTRRPLRLLWHARHAERSLLTYEDDDLLFQAVPEPVPAAQAQPRHRREPTLEAGPLLVCVDTSGSMQGAPETLAKAVVLAALRAAHAQRRACRVYAFSGPDEIVELELDLDLPGVERLGSFLTQGFRGGTEVSGPLERVLARLEDERWRQADLLIASDGEFGVPATTLAALADARARLGLRVQGVLICARETTGLSTVADDVFRLHGALPAARGPARDDRASRGAPGRPVNLTAAFFPGVLAAAGPAAADNSERAARAFGAAPVPTAAAAPRDDRSPTGSGS